MILDIKDRMTNHGMIVESSASGEEISAIVTGLEEALEGIPRGHAIISLLSFALVLMNPMITPEGLEDGVRDVSRYICLMTDPTMGDMDAPKVLLN